MIESIIIKNVATFDNSGTEIVPLKPINFIYGSNGSGKTTISKYLYSPESPAFAQCSIKWKNDRSVKTLVYNKDFRDRNFGKDTLNGVFTLGQATKEDLEAIEEKISLKNLKRNEIIRNHGSLGKLQDEKVKEQNTFREIVWTEIYKKTPNSLNEALQGAKLKEGFKTKLLAEFNSNISDLVIIDDLLKQAKIIFGDTPKLIPDIEAIQFTDLTKIETSDIWAKKIIGKSDIDIAALIQKLNINDWVNEGRAYINEDICPFCQEKTITNSFIEKLHQYFDESFLLDIAEVTQHDEIYQRNSQVIISHLKQIELREITSNDTTLPIELFTEEIKRLEVSINSNIELMRTKKKEVSRSLILNSTNDLLNKISELIANANKKIEEHNEIVKNYGIKRSGLIASIWKYLTEEHKTLIEIHLNKIKGFDTGIVLLKEKIDEQEKTIIDMDKEIKKLSQNVTSVQPSVNRINGILRAYGFQNFMIVPSVSKPNQYQILREDQSLAEATLSEGEVTFITFLYFLQLAEGGISEDSVTDERILIVDDPISSLDSNILFVISSLLKDFIKKICDKEGNIKQFILLTHNIYFHKEVTYIDGRTQERHDYAFWMLRRKDKISSVQSFGPKNTIHNSYELLWLELKNRDKNSSITIQNTMRRIIENYFKLLGKYGDKELLDQFEHSEEKYICKSLISWINDGSHSIPDDLFIEHQTDITDKYFEVFQKVFEYTGHQSHFDMMMKEKKLEVA